MKIYEIQQEIENLLEGKVDEETGEVIFSDEDMQKLDSLNMEKEKKIETVACDYINSTAEAESIKKRIKELEKRVKICENRAKRDMNYVEYWLGGESFDSDVVKVCYSKSTTTETDEQFIPWAKENRPEFLRYKPAPDPEVNKTEVAKAIKNGEFLEHAWREDHRKIKIV